MTATAISAFSAFNCQLKELCLNEFPCGYGEWRYDFQNKKEKYKHDNRLNSKFMITLKDHQTTSEKIESLQHYIKCSKSPWKLEHTWSRELDDLRQLAVEKPWLITDEFVLKFMKTLKIIGRNVTEIDCEMLKFKHLEELSLSANHIQIVNSKCLPRNLKVLELCGNEISDLSCIINQPPPLQHLGLSFNSICFLSNYLSGYYWPHLLSLDLGYNDLHDLSDVVNRLSDLPKLRNLFLLGNPLSLVPGYRGYVIDRLNQLLYVDEKVITADERYMFSGLKNLNENKLNEAFITIEVLYISGIPVPPEIKMPDDFPEYPIVERKYFVEIGFLKESRVAVESSTGDDTKLSDILDVAVSPQSQLIFQEENKDEDVNASVPLSNGSHNLNESPIHLTANDFHSEPKEPLDIPSSPTFHIKALKTEPQFWADKSIDVNWSSSLRYKDLVSLRDFCRMGTSVCVKEEKTLAYLSENDSTLNMPSLKKGKDGKAIKDDPKHKKGKESSSPAAKNKKKKILDENLVRSPPEYITVATFDLPLEAVIGGKHDIVQIYQKDLDPPTEDKDTLKKVPESHKDTNKDKRKKVESLQNIKLNSKKSDKVKGKKKKAFDEDNSGVPIPLEVKVIVKFHRWNSALESESAPSAPSDE